MVYGMAKGVPRLKASIVLQNPMPRNTVLFSNSFCLPFFLFFFLFSSVCVCFFWLGVCVSLLFLLVKKRINYVFCKLTNLKSCMLYLWFTFLMTNVEKGWFT